MTTVTDTHAALDLPVARLVDDRPVLAPDGWDEAMRLGAFFVPVPDDLDVAPGLRLCRDFFKPATHADDRYRGHREAEHPDSKLGYSDRPDQVEQLQLESAHWGTYLPEEVTTMLRRMERITLATLYAVFAASGVREEHWETISGGMTDGTGWCHSTLNHYRSNLPARAGIVEHTDSGFITLLYVDQDGLEVRDGGIWRPVEVKERYFVVNMGDAVEILTRNLPHPVAAVVHRVPESEPRVDGLDRSSFTVFMGPRYDMPLYQYDALGELREFQGFRDFSVAKAASLGYEFHPRL